MRTEFVVTAPARRDIAAIIRWSFKNFGEAAALRYEDLILQALQDLRVDPVRLGSKERPELMIDGARTYHLSYSKSRGARVKVPRHFILYRQTTAGAVEVVRILHDSCELERNLPEEFKRVNWVEEA